MRERERKWERGGRLYIKSINEYDILPNRSGIVLGHVNDSPTTSNGVVEILGFFSEDTGVGHLLNEIFLSVNNLATLCITEDNDLLCTE